MNVITQTGAADYDLTKSKTVGEAADLIALDRDLPSAGNGFTFKIDGTVAARTDKVPTGDPILELIEHVPADNTPTPTPTEL